MSRCWDVLGPFPIHAREQHFLSPSFPINVSEPIDLSKSWPSSYADGGSVSWSVTCSDDVGNLRISFPNIRWEALRSTEGWAALQHHSILRTSFVVHPPATPPSDHTTSAVRLKVHLKQGSFFAILPADNDLREGIQPKWHAGDIYAMRDSLPRVIDLPVPPSSHRPTQYNLFVSGDYEIRLSGDPRVYGAEAPILTLNIQIEIEEAEAKLFRVPNQDVIPDFVDGFAFGDALGIGLRSLDGWWKIKQISLVSDDGCAEEAGLTLTLREQTRIAPTQMRLLPIEISQKQRFRGSRLRFEIIAASDDRSVRIPIVITITCRPRWSETEFEPIKASYFYARSNPTPFMVVPPKQANLEGHESSAPLLALHGAGVDVLYQLAWAEAIPRQVRDWIVLPTGRTSWGLDWHGPSAEDAWASLDALTSILGRNPAWHPWKLKRGTKAVVLGHSNGGHGAWYLASRYPDRVLGVVAAACYIKSQAYISWTMSRFWHFIDPSLRSILETSMTADDNDLFLSNLVDKPVLAIHGGNDGVVSAWHTRESVGILQSWKSNANVKYREDANQPHWYNPIFKTEDVQAFIDSLTNPEGKPSSGMSFTLTVAIPIESGSLHGWQIERLRIPGCLGRLHVTTGEDGSIHVKTSNVALFSMKCSEEIQEMLVDGVVIKTVTQIPGLIRLEATSDGTWRSVAGCPLFIQPSGRFQTILSSAGPILLVIPETTPFASQEASIATRIALDLHNYHRIDAEIISGSEALDRARIGTLGEGNLVLIGPPSSPFARWVLSNVPKKSCFEIDGGCFSLKGHKYFEPDNGILFLHPHPTSSSSLVAFLSGTDSAGLERAARLIPMRTGILAPDWLVIGNEADRIGAAAVVSAGVWGPDWVWNEKMSWI